MILLIVAVLFSITTGEISIPLSDLVAVFQQKTGIEYTVLTQLRLPRILMAISVGGALSLTGTILQGIYRNPLVEPYTLGISGGGALGVALAIVFGFVNSIGAFVLPLFGFIGSLLTIFLVYFLSMQRGKGVVNINRMLLIGVMISFIASSVMMLLMSITTSDNLHNIVFWMMGSLEEPNLLLIKTMFYASMVGLVIAYLFAQPLNALRLGETKARHLGINTALTIRILFIVSSLLTGICVSVAGIIGFVGLVIPHLVRLVIGSDFRIQLICSFLGGSIFLLVSDIIARTIIAPNELPIGVITGLFGGIAFIVVLAQNKSKMK
jgi:iron complex transport system permease protein